MKAINLKKSRNGLTLLEVLVAVFILAIVAVPLLGLFANNAALLNQAYQRTNNTYKAKSLMEGLYSNNYAQLFQQGTFGTRKQDPASGKYYTVDLSPAGSVSKTSCYFHLIVGASGSGVFAGADGALSSGSLPTLSAANIADLRLEATQASTTYNLRQDGSGALLASGKKPAGFMPVILVVTKSETAPIKVKISGEGSVIVYSPPTLPQTSVSAPGASSLTIYNDDVPPTKLLVTAVLKVYKTASDPQPENIYQDTFSVGPLP